MFVDIIKEADLGWLATNNDQQSYQRFTQTSERARFGAFWTFCAYYVNWQSRFIWHNFVKVGDNWIKICNLAYIGTYNRCVKIDKKILNRLWKMKKKSDNLRGIFYSYCTLPPTRMFLLKWYDTPCETDRRTDRRTSSYRSHQSWRAVKTGE